MAERILPPPPRFSNNFLQGRYLNSRKIPDVFNGSFHITSAELLILQGLSEGLLYSQLAQKLSRSEHTIKNQARNMMDRDREIKNQGNLLRLITLAINDSRIDVSMCGVIPDNLLTKREWEIIQCMMEGLDSKQIAVKFKISPKTVGNHKKKIYTKLNRISDNNGTQIRHKDSSIVAMAAKTYKEKGELQEIVSRIFK